MLLVEIGMQESWKAITRRRVDIARALSNSVYCISQMHSRPQ